MGGLKELLMVDGRRPQVIRECVVVLDEEVSKKGGVTGLMIKGGFKVIRALEGGKTLERLVDWLLDEFLEAVDPFYVQYQAEDAALRPSFEIYLTRREAEVAEALLGVTDRRRQKAKNAILIKTYDGLRGTALQHVRSGVPAVGRLVQKYTAV